MTIGTLLKLALGALAASGVAFLAGYGFGYSGCRSDVYADLQANRVKILKDGKNIDAKALAADDPGLCALCLAGASCQTAKVGEPRDVLVSINPKPATNSYLIANDRQAAVSIAQHRGRYALYHCGVT